MTFQIPRTLVLSVTALAMLSAPVLLNQTDLPFVPDTAAMAGKGGNGGGNGGGSDNGSGNGGGNSGGGNSSSSESSGDNSGRSTASTGSQGVGKGRKSSTEGVVTTARTAGGGKERNIKAELAGLNSLKRNINGLMNSADPRMEGIRQFVIASAQADTAFADLKAAEELLNAAKSDYVSMANDLGLTGYTDYSPSALQARLDEIDTLLVTDTLNANLLAEQEALAAALPVLMDSAELAAIYDALAAYTSAEEAAATAGAASDEDSLRAALLAAANANRASDTYLTEEIMAWANDILGVGDSSGLIDDYAASN